MNILVHTDNHVEGSMELKNQVEATVLDALGRFGEWITRVEVSLGQESGHKPNGHSNNRCMMEARLAGHQPIATTHHAATLDQAIEGAAKKLTRLLDDTIGRLSADARGR